jgi:hypothetical protein
LGPKQFLFFPTFFDPISFLFHEVKNEATIKKVLGANNPFLDDDHDSQDFTPSSSGQRTRFRLGHKKQQVSLHTNTDEHKLSQKFSMSR